MPQLCLICCTITSPWTRLLSFFASSTVPPSAPSVVGSYPYLTLTKLALSTRAECLHLHHLRRPYLLIVLDWITPTATFRKLPHNISVLSSPLLSIIILPSSPHQLASLPLAVLRGEYLTCEKPVRKAILQSLLDNYDFDLITCSSRWNTSPLSARYLCNKSWSCFTPRGSSGW